MHITRLCCLRWVSIGLVSCPNLTLQQGKESGDYWVISWLCWLSGIDFEQTLIARLHDVGPIALVYTTLGLHDTIHWLVQIDLLRGHGHCTLLPFPSTLTSLCTSDYHYIILRHSLAMNTIGCIYPHNTTLTAHMNTHHTHSHTPHTTHTHTHHTHTHTTHHTHTHHNTQGKIGPKGMKGARGSKGMNVSTLQNLGVLLLVVGAG